MKPVSLFSVTSIILTLISGSASTALPINNVHHLKYFSNLRSRQKEAQMILSTNYFGEKARFFNTKEVDQIGGGGGGFSSGYSGRASSGYVLK